MPICEGGAGSTTTTTKTGQKTLTAVKSLVSNLYNVAERRQVVALVFNTIDSKELLIVSQNLLYHSVTPLVRIVAADFPPVVAQVPHRCEETPGVRVAHGHDCLHWPAHVVERDRLFLGVVHEIGVLEERRLSPVGVRALDGTDLSTVRLERQLLKSDL